MENTFLFITSSGMQMDVMPEAMRWLSGEKPHVKEGKEKAGGAWYVIVWSCDSSPECLPPDFLLPEDHKPSLG